MKITSKFNARCRKCGGWLLKGQQCEWERGVGVWHTGQCPTAVEPAQRAVTVTTGVFRKDGKIYVVKPNREKSRFYAMKEAA
jgi:hypothetical protein